MKTILKRPIVNDFDFLNKFLKIAIPVTLQSFFAASLNLVDNIMVGQLGETSIAGVGLANQFCFIMQVILFAITSAVSVFISQFWGAKNVENVRKALGLGLILAG
ncbi:MAG TPA: MATE family efflux transporter, partial [Clostridia bacterium]|nr:MATE family efflux transporter [Clostridia bacterium]